MITGKFTDFITGTHHKKVPKQAIDQAKLCFLDFLGVTLRGSKTRSSIAINNIVKEDSESTIIGHKKANILDSALANGIAAHCLDLDDGHRFAQMHPGACVIPAALSTCEASNKNGKEFINSIIAGYEVAISLGILVNPEHRNKGFHSTGTCGTFGATAAACYALNLDKKETLNALGLAGTQAAGLLESDHSGSMGKHLHAGKAAHTGVLSALLAKKGFTGASSIIDGKEGFISAMVNGDIKNKKLEIGNFHIQDVYFKKYPVCRHLHSTIDAAFCILNKNSIETDDIQKIIVKTYKIAANHDNYDPKTKEAIRQSLPVSLAIAVRNGNLSLDDLKTDDEIAKISSKIVTECDENLDESYPYKRSSNVIIQTEDHSYSECVDLPKGEPENQFTLNELMEKFIELNPEISADILEIINNLENYNMKELMIALDNEFKMTK
ncbi:MULTISPECIES: MmgE/PrpD family protein [Methanobacterium]|uniref:2-methylcitrate dehydratase n=1 Tax=Methanobacterium bryantii TaxID=2161 RepID=A0A2A2H2P7_METBR|nr:MULTISPECIES: MmgE/PrpD family protein [Methanobacterium]OEC86459.1 2-methylcitrate dehydratase [Methanobacterium sp. A39]PAV03662.1 2-methylcitrate dehydratase [Methanobacterium bryantii]